MINCPSNFKTIVAENPANRQEIKLTKATTNYSFPYVAGHSTYSLKFYDSTDQYRVKNITADKSGATFDENTSTISGITDGMTLTVTLEQNDKPYSYDIFVYSDYEYNIGNDSQLSLMYMRNGTKTKVPLQYGSNHMALAANNFPISVYKYDGMEPVSYYQESDIAIFSDKIHCFGSDTWELQDFLTDPYTTGEYTVNDPQKIEGKIYFNGTNWDYLVFNSSYDTKYEAGLEKAPTKTVDNYNSQTMRVYPGVNAHVHIDSDSPTQYAVKLRGQSYSSSYFQDIARVNVDENGDAYLPLPSGSDFVSSPMPNQNKPMYSVEIVQNTIPVRFEYENGNVVEWDYLMGYPMNPDDMYSKDTSNPFQIFNIAGSATIDLSSYLKVESDDKISAITAITTYDGTPLKLDSEGHLSGFGDVATGNEDEYSPLTLVVKKSELNLDQTLTVTLDYSGSTRKLTLGKGTGVEVEKTLTSNSTKDYKFNKQQMPIELNVYQGSGGGANKSYTTPYIYLNGSLISSSTSGSGEPSPVSLTNVPDKSILKIRSTKNDGNVTYEIEEGLSVAIYQDAERIYNYSSKPIAKGTKIKIHNVEGDDRKLEVYRNGTKLSDSEIADGFDVSNDTETIRVEVAKNVITFKASGSTDLSKLELSDADGNIYQLSGSNVLAILPSVNSLQLAYNVDGEYISAVNCDPNTMKFNEETGALTDLTTGSVTVSTKKIVREKEINIYLDGTEMQGANILLGSGKQLATSTSLSSGNQTINFGQDDLPLIFALPASYINEDGLVTSLPTVQVNGENMRYDEEKRGFILDENAFSDPNNPPIIRIYASEPKPSTITFMVEPGINFSAVPDGKKAEEVTAASRVQFLPGTEVKITVSSQTPNEEVYIESNSTELVSGTSIEYSFTVGQNQTFAVKRRKVSIKVSNADDWTNINVSGAGYSYPMYAAVSELEFPQGTTQLSLRSTSDEKRVSKVTNKKTGAEMAFDPVTGVVTGVTDGAELSIETSPLTRDKSVRLFLEDNNALATTKLILAKGKAVEKEVTFRSGYRDVAYSDDDRPLTVKPTAPITLYLNNELQSPTDGEYTLPADMVEHSVVKVYGSEQTPIAVNYDIDSEKFSVDVFHDGIRPVDATQTLNEFPGTEITIAVDINTLVARLAAARSTKARAANVNGGTEVSVNGQVIKADENDGMYHVTVLADHASTGLKIVVKVPDMIEGGVTYSGDGKTLISVDPEYKGELQIREGVTTIKADAFKSATGVTSVVVPNSVTTIESKAFSGATSLENVILGNRGLPKAISG